ncbi:MAG: sulfurtransferase complex subunit TusB [Aeromonas sp.]
MLHQVLTSPFTRNDLAQALAYWQADDALLLAQDGVLAAASPVWQARLVGIAVYVVGDDLAARGLTAGCGQVISLAQWVQLVAQYGSPLTWQ